MTDREERNTRTALDFLRHIVDGSGSKGKESFDQAFALVADDFEVQVMPGTLNMPRMKLARYRKWLEPMVAETFADFGMTVVATTAQDNRVVVEATSSATTKDGRPYGMEYFISFTFNDEGKIIEEKEFADSLYSARFYGLLNS